MTRFENLIVQKYGGATLADPSLVKAAAKRLLEQSKRGPLIAVVSAMGTTTNSLVDLAHQVSAHPSRRELDMLLSVGERISMSLMSMALQELGAPAISFTGSQAGIFTDEDHFNARIVDVRAHRVDEALRAGKIVILAGFQGVSPVTKEITTLGRGGSDVTAVAMAAAFGARRCEILKDVPAIFTADPRLVKDARPISRLSPDVLADMTFWGAKVLHFRSAALAREKKVSLYVGPASAREAEGTLISEGVHMFERQHPVSLNSHETVLQIALEAGDPGAALTAFQERLSRREIAPPQILGWAKGAPNSLRVTGPREVTDALAGEFGGGGARRLCSVTLTCAGGPAASTCAAVLQRLDQEKITPEELTVGSHSVTVFLPHDAREKALRVLHDLISSTAV